MKNCETIESSQHMFEVQFRFSIDANDIQGVTLKMCQKCPIKSLKLQLKMKNTKVNRFIHWHTVIN